MNKREVPQVHGSAGVNLNNQNSPHTFPYASTITPVSADFVSNLCGQGDGLQWVLCFTGGNNSHLLSRPTDLGADHPWTHVSS
jgi:hypothetical protein